MLASVTELNPEDRARENRPKQYGRDHDDVDRGVTAGGEHEGSIALSRAPAPRACADLNAHDVHGFTGLVAHE